jgi:pimeloyl-ACP methyl ester carboxylesterase
MATELVRVTGMAAAEPAEVWAIARDFGGAWHPFIERIETRRGKRGAEVRRFTTKGDDALYEEQLTYFSDSDRTLAYQHLAGIEGIDGYYAQLSVSGRDDGGCTIEWTARIEAPVHRAKEAALGTAKVFEAGIAALGSLAETGAAKRGRSPRAGSPPRSTVLETISVAGEPALEVTVTHGAGKTLVLFLHGIGGERGNWVSQLRPVGVNARAAALDLRGYGGSRLGLAQTTIDTYCDDILRVASALDAEKLILVGLSYGSWIATSFAMRYPDRLAGLVLSGGCTGMSEADVTEREAFRQSREAPLAAGKVPADFAPAVVEVLAGPNADEAVRATLRASMAAIPVATYRDAIHCFTHPPERFDFSKLTMPVLMMTGEHDRLAPPSEIRGVARRILQEASAPSIRFEVVPGAGHVCNVEQPEAYNAILLEWLRGIAP